MKLFYYLPLLFTFSFASTAQSVYIPDPNFKAKLLQADTTNNIAFDLSYNAVKVDTNDDGEIQITEAQNIKSLMLDSCNINSLEGIGSFSNLYSLYCSYNPFTEINLCGTSVYYLFCSDAPNLTSVNLKNNVNSETIWNEPPFPPFWVWNLPSLQYVCADPSEMYEAQMYFPTSTTNPIIFTSGCDVSSCFSLSNTNHVFRDFTITVFPNPTHDILNISLSEPTEIQSVNIYNTLGQKIHSFSNPTQTIDVSELKTGTYFIRFITDKGITTSTFIKD